MQGWFSASSLVGMLIALAFGALASRDLRQGILWYVVLGAVPLFEVGAFSGAEMVQGMPLAEVLATVLVIVWLLQRHQVLWRRLLPFERWLLLILPATVLSLASGYTFMDPAVVSVHVNVAVSIGQILLFAWPILLYFVAADVMDRPEHRRWFVRLMLLLALPQWATLFVPAAGAYVFWATTFGLIAAPLAIARATFESIWWKRLLLASYVLPPLIEGMRIGKAFLYGYILISTLIVLYLRARKLLTILLPAIGLLTILAIVAPDVVPLPDVVDDLIQTEEAQQSLGGRAGRGQLFEDAIEIWSGYPTFGVGPGNSYPYMMHYSVLGTPHSQYADLLLEGGAIGVGLFAIFIGTTLWYGWRALPRRRDRDSEIFIVAWFGSFTALALVSLTGDYMLHSIRNGGIEMFTGFYVHWLFLGFTMAMIRREGRVRATVPATVRPQQARAIGPLVWDGPRRPASAGTR